VTTPVIRATELPWYTCANCYSRWAAFDAPQSPAPATRCVVCPPAPQLLRFPPLPPYAGGAHGS
jgi:hypothetical protein